jgi:transglutaminase-like putative cysteine protease
VTMTMSTAFAGPLLDPARLDLDGAERIRYRVEQRFQYSYDAPVSALSQRLVVVPRRQHGDLFRRAHRVRVVGAPALRRTRQNAAGNTIVRVTADRVEHRVEFQVTAVVDRVRADRAATLPAAALYDRALLRATRLTKPDDAIRALGAGLGRPAPHGLDLAERACSAVHAAMTYEYGATTVRTTAAEALAIGRGVCQDFAHIMLAACRAAGVPARYVSGHLLGQEGGSHAWVEVLVADGSRARAIAVDPTNSCRAAARHLPVAVGRDYTDVAPTSGVYSGPARGRLTWVKRAGVTAAGEPAARPA